MSPRCTTRFIPFWPSTSTLSDSAPSRGSTRGDGSGNAARNARRNETIWFPIRIMWESAKRSSLSSERIAWTRCGSRTYLKSTRPIGLPRNFGNVFTSSWEIRYVRCEPTGGGNPYSSGSLSGGRSWGGPSRHTGAGGAGGLRDPEIAFRARRVDDEVHARDRPRQGNPVLDIQLLRLDRDASPDPREHPRSLPVQVDEQEGGHPRIPAEFGGQRPTESPHAEDCDPHPPKEGFSEGLVFSRSFGCPSGSPNEGYHRVGLNHHVDSNSLTAAGSSPRKSPRPQSPPAPPTSAYGRFRPGSIGRREDWVRFARLRKRG